MVWYLRKAISRGPVRLNLSRGGVGCSVGIKGLRAGMDAHGRPYTHAGRYGFYARQPMRGRWVAWVIVAAVAVLGWVIVRWSST